MKLAPTALPGVVVVEPRRFHDERGWFMESFNERKFGAALEAAGLPPAGRFVQDNLSRSHRHVLRGLHYQLPPHAQGKLVGVVHGKVWDVALDVRRHSPTLGRWTGIELSADSPRQLWVPPGFAHGFVVLSDEAVFSYKTTDFYDPASERAIRWDDPALGIEWPLPPGAAAQLAGKDREAPLLAGADLFD
ncbi:MAG: dTDP-4-dehydrorhamnose 3,5-epimerase [Pseudomonadota bacterium]